MIIIHDLNRYVLSDFISTGNVVIPFYNKSTTDRTKISLIAFYVYNVNDKNEYIFNFKHNDVFKVKMSLNEIPLTGSFIYDSQVIERDDIYDLELYYWWLTENELSFNQLSQIDAYKRILKRDDLRFIPLTILIDQARIIKNLFVGINDMKMDFDLFKIYQKNVFDVFKRIEKPGLNLDTNHIKVQTRIKSNRICPNYKLFTATGRPSNTYNGVNMAALNKSDGTRSMVIPDKDSILIEWDYSAFHIRLISKLIDYELPNGNLHDYFGRQYFGTPFLTDSQYDESKAISFRISYGVIDERFKDIPFFKKLHKFREKLNDEYQKNGFIRSVIFSRPIGLGKDLPENKLFNYLLQSYETEYNAITLNNLNNYLLYRDSYIMLYTYDSFLINLNRNDGNIINDLTSIIYHDGFHGTIKTGKNYNEMERHEINRNN